MVFRALINKSESLLGSDIIKFIQPGPQQLVHQHSHAGARDATQVLLQVVGGEYIQVLRA